MLLIRQKRQRLYSMGYRGEAQLICTRMRTLRCFSQKRLKKSRKVFTFKSKNTSYGLWNCNSISSSLFALLHYI